MKLDHAKMDAILARCDSLWYKIAVRQDPPSTNSGKWVITVNGRVVGKSYTSGETAAKAAQKMVKTPEYIFMGIQ